MASYYHGLTKQIIGQFGAFFADLHIIRRLHDSVNGRKGQDIKVPISYAPKEKWWQAFVSDPARQKQTAITLPRMSFEILGFTYDNQRKTTRSKDIRCVDENGSVQTMSTPAPWNMELALYVVGNNQEDVFQVIEQILPLFNPDRTIKLKVVPSMNIIENVPISLTSVAIQDDYDGDYATHRLIVYTLTFTVKMNYYGQIHQNGPIYDVEIGEGDGGIHVEFDKESGTIKENWLYNTEPINIGVPYTMNSDSVEVEFEESGSKRRGKRSNRQ